MRYDLPVYYDNLNWREKANVRNQYIRKQDGKCFYCGENLSDPPPDRITKKYLRMEIFPKGFLDHPVHLQHDHISGLTEGAVHAYCNGVMWQYEGR